MKLKDLYEGDNIKWFQREPIITIDSNKYVVHTTGKKAADDIRKNGFKTGRELNVAEKRSAIYFSDKSVNVDMYARNKEGETYDGQEADYIEVSLKGLRLLNLSYKVDGTFPNHRQYNNYVVRGMLEELPDVDGSISFLDDGSIFEVALSKEMANKLLKR